MDLCARPASTKHRFDDCGRCDVVEVAGGGAYGCVAELAGDDTDVDTFGTELSGVRVAKAMCMDTLLDAGSNRETLEKDADVSIGYSFPLEGTEGRLAATQVEMGSGVEPRLDDGSRAWV